MRFSETTERARALLLSEVNMSKQMVLNHTAGLRRSIKVATRSGVHTATIDRIGAPSVGRDGRMWSMVYGTTTNGLTPIAFAAVNDGPPAWMLK